MKLFKKSKLITSMTREEWENMGRSNNWFDGDDIAPVVDETDSLESELDSRDNEYKYFVGNSFEIKSNLIFDGDNWSAGDEILDSRHDIPSGNTLHIVGKIKNSFVVYLNDSLDEKFDMNILNVIYLYNSGDLGIVL